MVVMSTAVRCFLCQAAVPYTTNSRAKLLKHLEGEHGAFQGVEFLVAGCTMTEKEREAVEKVVRNRQPALVRLPVEEDASDDEGMVLEPEVEIQVDEGRAGRLEEEGVDDVTVEEEEGVSPPRSTPPRRKECPDCPMSFKLQIQLNRHKKSCTKSEGGRRLFVPSPPRGLKLEARSASKLKMKVEKRRLSLPARPAMVDEANVTTLAERRKMYPNGGGNNKLVPPPGKGIACNQCGKEFFTRGRMRNHVVDVHEQGHFPCKGEGCGKVFTSMNKMSSHYSKNCSPNTELGRAGLAKRGIAVA